MPYSGMCVFGRAGIAAAVVVVACGAAAAQSGIGPSVGTVELRWRERSTPGYNGSYTIGPGTAPGVDAVPTPDPSAVSVTTQDASVVLVLEAKVTQAAGLVGNPIRGLRAAGFDIMTNQTSGGAFARYVATDSASMINPRANARINTLNLGFNPTTLPGHEAIARSVVAPFRGLGAGGNGPGLGIVGASLNRIQQPIFGAVIDLFQPTGEPGEPPPPGYEVLGLNTWVPIYLAVYTITDVTTPREVVFTPRNTFGHTGAPTTSDYNFRTWRGMSNPDNTGLDFWQLTPGFTTPPSFTVRVVPAPAGVGVLAIGALVAVRRRR